MKVTTYASVEPTGLQLNEIVLKVNDAAVFADLQPADFAFTNVNTTSNLGNDLPANKIATSVSVDPAESSITIKVVPFGYNGSFDKKTFTALPWEMTCEKYPELNITLSDVTERKTDILDDCLSGSFTYAGLTRRYMLYLPKEAAEGPVPLMVWQIGGGEYAQPLEVSAGANECLVAFAKNNIPCAALMFALDNENYYYSASEHPEKIELIDRNNALQAAFIKELIKKGTIDGEHVYCAGASSGGGCTMRFSMAFPELFACCVPVCSMDPITPIHQTQKTEEKVTEELKVLFNGNAMVYRFNEDGSQVIKDTVNKDAFLKLPLYFAHAGSDIVCKAISSKSYYAARKFLGAKDDMIRIYTDEEMLSYGFAPGFMSHFSWVPVLREFQEGTPMDWMLKH